MKVGSEQCQDEASAKDVENVEQEPACSLAVGNKVDDGDAFAAALEVVVACARVCQHHHPEERHDGGDEAGLTRWRR